jgi:hypothetical protein
MTLGKCWIYKRATLHIPGMPPQIVDYSDGTEEFDCGPNHNGERPIYEWKLPGETIPIPLNIPRKEVNSIIRNGVIEYQDGELHWEFIFGKFKPNSKYYMNKLKQCSPFLIAILILIIVLRK